MRLDESQYVANLIKRRLGQKTIIEAIAADGVERIVVDTEKMLDVIEFIKSDPDCAMDILVDIFCMKTTPQEILYWLRSTKLGYQVQLCVRITQNHGGVFSVRHLYQNAGWLEKEMQDRFDVIMTD